MFDITLSEDEGWYLFKAVRHESIQLERLINRTRQSEKGRLDARLTTDVSNDFHCSTGILGLLQQHFEDDAKRFKQNRHIKARSKDIEASPYHKLPVNKEE